MATKQTMRYSDAELGLIKATFAERDDLLIAMRKVFLQFPLTLVEKEVLKKTFASEEVQHVVRKTFLPTLDGDAPLHQMIDLWGTMPIKEKDPFSSMLVIKMTKQLSDYYDQQLRELTAIGDIAVSGKSHISFAQYEVIGDKDPEQLWVDMMTRNTLVQQTDINLNQLLILAGNKEETVEQTMNRLRKNSSK